MFIPYSRYVRILKWLTLALLAYVATAFVMHILWTQVLINTVLPHLSWKPEYITTVVAVFGTTISIYLFFWQASQEAEEMAKGFYGIIALSILIGVGLCFTSIDPIKALYWSAVINGVISVPIMVVMMLMAIRPDVMGRFVISFRLKVLGWVCTAVMAMAVIAMFWSLG